MEFLQVGFFLSLHNPETNEKEILKFVNSKQDAFSGSKATNQPLKQS